MSKDKKEVWCSHPVFQQEGLHHTVFYNKKLGPLILLNGWCGSMLSPLLMFIHQNVLGIIAKLKHSEDSYVYKGD